MRLLRSFPVLAHAVLLLSIVGVGVATENFALLLVCGVLAAMSWYVTEGPRGKSLPTWTANVLVLAAALSALVDLAQHYHDVMAVLARFIVWLTLIKLYQQKSPRDYAQLLGLSLLLMLIGALLSTDLLFAAVVFIYAMLGLYALLLFRLYAAHERSRAARLAAIPAGYRVLPSVQPVAGTRTAVHLRSLVATVAVSGLAASTILFLLFPRDVGGGFLGGFRQPYTARTGFTTEVDLIGGTRITESQRAVLHMTLTGGRSPVEPLLLRGAVLDRYLGHGRWSASASSPDQRVETEPPELRWLGGAEHRRTITQSFTVIVQHPVLFSVYVPVAVSTDEPRHLNFDGLTQTIEDVDPGRLDAYRIRADLAPDDETLRALAGSGGPADGAAIVDQFRDFDGRVADRAREVLASRGLPDRAPDDEAQIWAWRATAAAALAGYLRATQTNGFTYSTDLSGVEFRSDGSQDPIVQFLFTTRIGHCEYFASALAALCNCVGIPARLVTGYAAREYDPRLGAYVIREAHAHAWVEVQISPWRWRAFDPTPPSELGALDGGPGRSLADRWRWLFDRFEASWADGFVAFDANRQAQLMERLDMGWAQKLGGAWQATRQWLAAVNRAFYFGPAGYIWMGIVGLALVIAAIALGMRMKRAARLRAAMHLERLRGGAYHRMLRQLGFYLDMLEVLQQSGRAKPAWQPPLHFAQALSARHDPGASLVRRLTERFYAARYGGRRLTRDELTDAQALVNELRAALR
jgi:transglutaminase-like putative cysteine protease